jgi:tetratricopeptide (TPR) repeat protein
VKSIKFILFIFVPSFLLLWPAACRHQAKNETSIPSGKFPLDTIEIKIDELTKKIRETPSSAIHYYQRALLYEIQKKPMLAIKDMQTVVGIDSARFQYFDYLADLFFQANGVKPAIAAYKKSTALNPKSDYPYVKMGEIYMLTQDAQKAFENLNIALHINKHNGKTYFLKGFIYLEMGDTGKAISNFQTSIDVDPDYYDSYINLGIIYAKRKNKLSAFYYESCLRLKPGTIEVLYDLGKYYQDIDNLAMATKYYNQILEKVPDHKNANYNMGYINYINQNFETAIGYFNKAILKFPSYPDAYYARGQCYKMLKKNNEAIADFNKAFKLDPKNTAALTEYSRLIK